jgi:glycosyltransferase involved in cell wall biosynthesis
MKILIITSSFLPQKGGAEFAVHNLASRFLSFGNKTTVLNAVSDFSEGSYDVEKYLIIKGSRYYGYHRFPIKQFEQWQIRKRIEKHSPDIIMAHFGWPVGMWVGTMGLDIPFSITCHGPALNVTPRGPRAKYNYKIDPLLARSMNNSVAAVAISSHAKEIMLDIGVKEEKIVRIPNGVDVGKFSIISAFNLREHFGLPKDSKIILSVGRESYAKAYDVAIKAFSKVKNKDVYYVVLGKGTSKWKEYAKELGCSENVITCEGLFGSDLIGVYQQADIFTLPSIKELCPLVVPEAMAAGRPIVVTNVSGSQDMIENGENGIVVEPGNVEKLAIAWMELLEDNNKRLKFSEANLKLAPQYDWGIIAQKHLDCFKR